MMVRYERTNFEFYAARILSLNNHENLTKINLEKKIQNLFQVKTDMMKMASIKKCQFARLNYKRYYFSDDIVSFPFSHPYLAEIKKDKKEGEEEYKK